MKAILLRLRPARSRIMTMMSNADEAARIVVPAGAARSMALRRLPVRQRLVRLRDRRIHDLAVLTGAGGQFDDIAVGIAEIDRPDKAVGERFVQQRVGLHHLCLRARSREDVDRCATLLKEIGAKIVRGPMEGTWAPGYYYLLFEDPDGIRLEVNFVPGAGLLAEGANFNPGSGYDGPSDG